MSEAIRRPGANPSEDITDSLGRVLTVRALTELEGLDLAEAAGSNADNRSWMIRATLYACVRAIDGVPLQFPATKAKIRAAAAVVGGEGVAALANHFAPPTAGDDEGESGEDVATVAKN